MPDKPERPSRERLEQEPEIIESTMHPAFKDPAFVEAYNTGLEYERRILSLHRRIDALTAELAAERKKLNMDFVRCNQCGGTVIFKRLKGNSGIEFYHSCWSKEQREMALELAALKGQVEQITQERNAAVKAREFYFVESENAIGSYAAECRKTAELKELVERKDAALKTVRSEIKSTGRRAEALKDICDNALGELWKKEREQKRIEL